MKKYMKTKMRQKYVSRLSLKESSRNRHMTLLLTLNWPTLNLILHQTARDCRKYTLLYSTQVLSEYLLTETYGTTIKMSKWTPTNSLPLSGSTNSVLNISLTHFWHH